MVIKACNKKPIDRSVPDLLPVENALFFE